MNEQLISVIVAAYNIQEWIAQCLDSILNQTYKNLEIIVIDDGSTDDTGKIIDDYAKHDKRIIPVHQKNVGLVRGRERGIELAKGHYITFVDGDDSLKPDMYERLMRNLIKYNADISHCGMDFCWVDGRVVSHYNTNEIRIQNNIEGQIDLLNGNKVEPSLCTKIYKKELLIDSCLDLDILNNEDLLRNYIVFKRANKSVFEDFCGYNYFIRKGSISRDFSKAVRIEQHIFTARKIIAQNCSDPDVKPYAITLWVASAINGVNHLIDIKTNEADKYRKECRKFLIEHYKDLKLLHPKQRLAALLIIISPKFQSFIYSLYRK